MAGAWAPWEVHSEVHVGRMVPSWGQNWASRKQDDVKGTYNTACLAMSVRDVEISQGYGR
jgi:hypothetical protein